MKITLKQPKPKNLILDIFFRDIYLCDIRDVGLVK